MTLIGSQSLLNLFDLVYRLLNNISIFPGFTLYSAMIFVLFFGIAIALIKFILSVISGVSVQ
jgi:hypothetical protein